MKLKLGFLFTALYLGAYVLLSVNPAFFPVFFIMSQPAWLIVSKITQVLIGPYDGFLFTLAAMFHYFIIGYFVGYFWDARIAKSGAQPGLK